jgi:hypothetical protein
VLLLLLLLLLVVVVVVSSITIDYVALCALVYPVYVEEILGIPNMHLLKRKRITSVPNDIKQPQVTKYYGSRN